MLRPVSLKVNPKYEFDDVKDTYQFQDRSSEYTDVFSQHTTVTNSKLVVVDSAESELDVQTVLSNIQDFKKFVSTKYIIEKPLNYYAIIRTATPREKLIEKLLEIDDFYADKSLTYENKLIRLGNVKNVVFYHCPVFKDLKKYQVDVGLKNGKNILLQHKASDGLAFTFEFNRLVVKNPSTETTKIMHHPNDGKVVSLDVTQKEINEIPSSVPITRLPPEEIKKIGKKAPVDPLWSLSGVSSSVPVNILPVEEFKKVKEKIDKLTTEVRPLPYNPEWKKAHLPLEGSELEMENKSKLYTELREEMNKILERDQAEKEKNRKQELLKELKEIEEKELKDKSSNKCSGKTLPCDSSTPIDQCDYETRKRAYSHVTTKKTDLPTAYVEKAKGFYFKEEGESLKLRNKSDDYILLYKLEKMLEFAPKFNSENVLFSKMEEENLRTYKTTLVKYQFLSENDISFVLVKHDDFDFNFYGKTVKDKQQLQEKTYRSLFDLVKDFKEKQKEHLIFVKNFSTDEYVEALSPSWKGFNEFKIKCYFLPKKEF